MRKYIWLLPLALLVLFAGCQGPVELAGVRRVAVLTADPGHGPSALGLEIKREFLAQLPRRFTVEVIDGAPIEAQLPLGFQYSPPDTARIAALCKAYGADAFILTSVTRYEKRGDGRVGLLDAFDASMRRPGVKLELGVDLAFNATLIRAEDGHPLFGRSAHGSSFHRITLDPRHPLMSLHELLEPHFDQVRREAVRSAVYRLLREIANTRY